MCYTFIQMPNRFQIYFGYLWHKGKSVSFKLQSKSELIYSIQEIKLSREQIFIERNKKKTLEK